MTAELPTVAGQSAKALASHLDAPPPDFFPELSDDARRASFFAESTGEYTGDRFFAARPEDYRECVRLRAAGVSLRKIAARLRPCSVNTVRAVLRREASGVDTRRAKTVDALTDFIEDACERLRDEPMPIGQLSVAMGIAVEKLQLLTGGATARVEIIEPVKPLDLDAYLDSLPTAGTGMGLGAAAAEQKAVLGAGDAALQRRGGDAASDCQSLAPSELAGHGDTTDATCDQPDQCGEDVRGEGRGGAENPSPPATLPIHSPESAPDTKAL